MKAMSKMKLTKNERGLLILLLVLILLIGIWKCIISPQYLKIKSLKIERNSYRERTSEIKNILESESEVLKENHSLNIEKEVIASRYFSNLDQADILYYLNSIFRRSKIEILDFNFTRPEENEIDGYGIKAMDITIPYRGTYNELIKIVENIATGPKKVLITDLTMDKEEEVLRGSMILKIYSIESLLDSEEVEGKYIEDLVEELD